MKISECSCGTPNIYCFRAYDVTEGVLQPSKFIIRQPGLTGKRGTFSLSLLDQPELYLCFDVHDYQVIKNVAELEKTSTFKNMDKGYYGYAHKSWSFIHLNSSNKLEMNAQRFNSIDFTRE